MLVRNSILNFARKRPTFVGKLKGWWTISLHNEECTRNSNIRLSSSSSSGRGNAHQDRSVTLYNSLTDSYSSIPFSSTQDECTAVGTESIMTTTPRGLAWYTCGPTVYDSAHLGHARTYVSLDIIQRALLHNYELEMALHSGSGSEFKSASLPPRPIFIMNVTDVDDKILAAAKERGMSPTELTSHFEEEFWQDLEQLNVMKPTIITRVTDHVECSIIPYIQKIVDNGMAYTQENNDDEKGRGSVYFDVKAFEAAKGILNKYGKLATNSARSDEVFFERENPNSVDDDVISRKQQKRDPRDFVLWKSRINEGEDLCWNSPWGKGRPGWHIECSAMIDYTMEQLDNYDLQIHAGGIDLKFPHHTNEIAQAEAYRSSDLDSENNSGEWIPHWVHTGHLHIDGLKMSKSLKNFITIRDILNPNGGEEVGEEEEHHKQISALVSPADDFRLWCLGLSGSYRGPATYSKSRLNEAKVTREKLLRFLIDGEQWLSKEKSLESPSSTTELDACAFSGSEEHHLVQKAIECKTRCEMALRGLNSDAHNGAFDFDGSSYLSALIELSVAGNKYIANNTNTVKRSMIYNAVYPVEEALSVMRKCLSIVGFSEKTTRTGLSSFEGNMSRNIEGGEDAVIEELHHFRSKIRDSALDFLRCAKEDRNSDEAAIEFTKSILAQCDELRDKYLPSIGVQLFDGDAATKWRYCIPRTEVPLVSEKSSLMSKSANNNIIAAEESNYFQTGHYSGAFSSFTPNGFPTHNADGSEISKRLEKKLKKKLDGFLKKQK